MPQYPGIGPINAGAAARVYLAMMAGLDGLERSQDCMSLKYTDLDDPAAIRSAWDFLIGDVQPWSDYHWEEMRHMRVVVRPDTYEVI